MKGMLPQLKTAAVYAIAILSILLIRAAFIGIVAYAQSSIPFCPNAQDLQNFIKMLKAMLLIAIIVIVIFVLLFNMFGFISTIAMRVGEFFNERLRFVFELILIYVFFLWHFDESQIIQEDQNGCAKVAWSNLFDNGPLFFQLVGWLLKLLGLVQSGTSP